MSQLPDSSRSCARSLSHTNPWSPTTLAATLAFVAAFMPACAPNPRVVLVPPTGAVLRVGPDAKARVYVEDGSGGWELSANEVPLAEGWYLIDAPE